MRQFANNQLLNSTTSNSSGWFDASQYEHWTIHVYGAEEGATYTLYGTNEVHPGSLPDSNAISLGTGSLTVPLLIESSAVPGPVQYIQLVKTPGGSPVQTIARIFAQLI